MKVKNRRAFTIVEIVIVIAVMAILSSIAALAYNTVREDARDATRQGNVAIIAEALEKYYEKNGEYPSVASLVNNYTANTGSAVAAKLSIAEKDLIMPQMPSSSTNALTSSANPHSDYIVYAAQSAVNNTSCQNSTTGGCDEFTLTYAEEGSGTNKTVQSRRKSR